MTDDAARWRPMRSDDLTAVLSIADAIHTDYPEEIGVFVDRLSLFPDGCLVAEMGAEGARVTVGYLIAHPAVLGDPPPLDTRLGFLAPNADSLYLHDIALLAEGRGRGLPAKALIHLEMVAREVGLARLSLTSTPTALAYWVAAGFIAYVEDGVASDGRRTLAEKLASYGGGMVHMWRAVPSPDDGGGPRDQAE